MPLYDFRCASCEHRFEANVPHGQLPPCPACGSVETEKRLAPFAGPFRIGLRGYAARKSDARRNAREEQRVEARATEKEQRKQEG
jgi:putative FmdB family regulatory protein